MGLMIILLLFVSGLTVLSQERHTAAGIDLCGIVCSRIGIDLEYRINSHWSANGFISFQHNWFNREKSPTEREHTSSFTQDKATPSTNRHGTHCEHITASYWPMQVYKGFFISTGLQHNDSQGMDGLIGIGYSMNIWQDIHIKASYFTPILQSADNGPAGTEGLRLQLCYNF